MFQFGTILKRNVTPIKLRGAEVMSESDLNSTTNYGLNFKAVQGVSLRRHRKNTHINWKNYSPVYWSDTAQHLQLGNLLPRTNQAAQAEGKVTGGGGRVRPMLPGG